MRKYTEDIVSPLSDEDCVVQPVVFTSPAKWHLGHTTWFFETFILRDFCQGYRVFDQDFSFVFNSYYESEGERLLRVDRGLLTRPSLQEVKAYRKAVNEYIVNFLENLENPDPTIFELMELGIQHEQQHQELMFYDIKYTLGHSPLLPAYTDLEKKHSVVSVEKSFLKVSAGTYDIGHAEKGFCYDNELGRHKVYLEAFEIGDFLVSNEDYLAFIEDGGYTNFNYWLAEGWDWVNQNHIKAPLYWHQKNNQWVNYTLGGVSPIDLSSPVTHISYYEADAYATWKGCRLATEFEWEVAAGQFGNIVEGVFMEGETFHPCGNSGNNLFGNVWEWTSSAYLPYPYFKKAAGAVGEYNGKFMVNQKVLKGGSCVTPSDHVRLTYRNFFHPDLRWMFSGIRLARHSMPTGALM